MKRSERMALRAALFQRRGREPELAQALARRLVQRDIDHDDRRVCLECTHLQQDGGCFAARQGRIPGASRRLEPVQDILQRCDRFEEQSL